MKEFLNNIINKIRVLRAAFPLNEWNELLELLKLPNKRLEDKAEETAETKPTIME